MKKLVTYLGDSSLKAAFLSEIGKHEVADQIIKGSYRSTQHGIFKACAIGCSLHSLNLLQGKKKPKDHTGDHASYEKELGLPTWLAYLEDHIFETLPNDEAMTWPRRFAEAIPVGVTVPDLVLAKILRWTLADSEWGVRNVTDKPDVIAAIDGMAALFDRVIAGDPPSEAEWDASQAAAWDAWAHWAARDAWAAWAAWAAWDDPKYNGAKSAQFSTALARYVVEELRALELVPA